MNFGTIGRGLRSIDDTREGLIVASWGGIWDRALRHAVSRPFTDATGMPVTHVTYVGLGLPQQLLKAARMGRRPPFDVVWSNAVPALRAAAAGLCEVLTPDQVPNLRFMHRRAQPPGIAGWPVVMTYVVFYVLVFRRAAFPSGAPHSWRVLLDPRHRGKVALYPDGNGIHAVAQVLGGGRLDEVPRNMEPCWRFLRELRPQVGDLNYSVGMEERLIRGDLDLCFRALPNARGFQEAGANVDWVAPREGIPDTADALWLPGHLSPDKAALAKAYVNFALSQSVQEKWCDLLGVIPTRADARAPKLLTAAPHMPSSLDDQTRLLHISDGTKLSCDDVWRERFKAIFA
jgi:putative spermidine/putrescine transport system substrate-binding protein